MKVNQRRRILNEDLITTRIQPIGASMPLRRRWIPQMHHVIAAQNKEIPSAVNVMSSPVVPRGRGQSAIMLSSCPRLHTNPPPATEEDRGAQAADV